MDRTLGWVDLSLLAVLLLSLVLGLWRGFLLEVLALLGWVAAYLAAQWLAPVWSPHLPIGEPGSSLNHGASFAVAFLAVLVLWGLASRLLCMLLNATPLRGADRLLGAVFGLLRGVVLLLVAATLVALTPAAHLPPWKDSQGAHWLAAALQNLKPLLPRQIAQFLPA
jgi:membrane protein required for colicin V production